MKVSLVPIFGAVVVSAIVSVSQAAFLETFDGMAVANGTLLTGQTSGSNTWVSLFGPSGRLNSSAGLNGASRGIIGNFAEQRANAIAIEAGTIGAGPGTFILTMDMLDDPDKYVGLAVGTSGLLDGSDNYIFSQLNDTGIYDRFRSVTNGVSVADSAHLKTLARATNTWKSFKIEVDLDASSVVTGARQYIDGSLAGTWVFGSTPAWSPTHVGFILGASGAVADPMADNFAYSFVAVPEPVSTALVGIGMVMLMRRRGSRGSA